MRVLELSHSGCQTAEVKSLSRVRLFTTPRTVAHQAPPSLEFSRQEHSSGLPFSLPGDLSLPGSNFGTAQKSPLKRTEMPTPLQDRSGLGLFVFNQVLWVILILTDVREPSAYNTTDTNLGLGQIFWVVIPGPGWLPLDNTFLFPIQFPCL